MGILAWIVLGLIAGAIAKALMPGKDPGGIIVTMLIGIVGAFIGGFLGNTITGSGLNGFSLWSILLAVVGAMLLLWIYRSHDDRTPHGSGSDWPACDPLPTAAFRRALLFPSWREFRPVAFHVFMNGVVLHRAAVRPISFTPTGVYLDRSRYFSA